MLFSGGWCRKDHSKSQKRRKMGKFLAEIPVAHFDGSW
jgi:hypothetical protein